MPNGASVRHGLAIWSRESKFHEFNSSAANHPDEMSPAGSRQAWRMRNERRLSVVQFDGLLIAMQPDEAAPDHPPKAHLTI